MAPRVEIHGMTRSAFLVRSALAAGGLYGAGAVAPVVSRALAAGGGGDVGVFKFALTLEQIESAFYKQALAVKGLSPEVKKVLQEIAAHEDAHVKQLTQTLQQLGASPAPAPKTSFPALGGQAAVLRLAVTLEDTGVGAYNGAAATIKSPDLLAAAGSIVQVEGRHAGAVRELAGRAPAPAAFDRALATGAVLARVKPFVKG
ncbi:MAG: hypothetical protein QOK25_2522 [Thermoleophilaceae bacterium]|jgi:rubrerythrin|nr:hypothetical protein [Thermoleophilaceae bacterium]